MIIGNCPISVIPALQSIYDTSTDIKVQRETLPSLKDVNVEHAARMSHRDKSLAAAKCSAPPAKSSATANAKAAQDKSEDVIEFTLP